MAIFILDRIASLFLAYSLTRIKKSKLSRDIQAKWFKDNYSSQVKTMFTAALLDAKAFFDFPSELMNDLLEDTENRNEVFRWIIEGVRVENFEKEKLNLLPYMERYRRYEDMLEPFFLTILTKIHEYQESQWTPEFLQILSKIGSIEQEIKDGLDRIENSQGTIIKKQDEQTALITAYFEPVSFDDLNELIKSGEVKIARERALERLKGRRPLNTIELTELNAVIGSCYFLNGQEKEAIPYLYSAISFCQDDARKHRINSLISLFEDHYEDALMHMDSAIKKEGYSKNNLEKLINIYIKQDKRKEALDLIEKYSEFDLKELHAYILIEEKQFDKSMALVETELLLDTDSFNWLLIKAEILTLNLEDQILKDRIVNTEQIYELVTLLINKLERTDKQNDRINVRLKELKAAVSFRNQQFVEAKVNFEWLYYHKQDNEGFFYFNNFLSCCLIVQDWAKAIELLTERIDSANVEIDDFITLARVYVDSGDPEQAKRLLEEKLPLLDKHSLSSLKYYFTYIDSLTLTLNHAEIENLIRTIEQENYIETGIHALKAYYATINHDWDNAVSEWEASIDHLDDHELFSEAAINLSLAYINRGSIYDFTRLTELIVRIPYWHHHEHLVNRLVRALYELNEYEEIIRLYNDLPKKSLMFIELVTTIYFNFGWYDIAKDNYMALYQKNNDFAYLCKYAHCLFRSGSTQECLETLSSIERKIIEKPSVENYQLLSVSFMNSMNFEKGLEYAYKTFEIGKENPDVNRFYFWSFVQITQYIDNPRDELIQAYQFVINNFNRQFPEEEPLFAEVKALNDDNTISDEFIEKLRSQNESYEQTSQKIKSNKLPPSFMAEFLKRGPYETWMHYYLSTDLDTWVLQGDVEEIRSGIWVAEKSNAVLCDSFILLTLRKLNLLDDLASMYKLYIHQEDFNKLFEELLQKKIMEEKGLKTLAYRDGKIIFTESSAEQVKEYIKEHEDLIEWINKNCEKIGKKLLNENKSDNRLDFVHHSIEACRDQSLNMMVDSHVLRVYAKGSFGVESFNVYEWMTLLHVTGKIDKDKYLDSFGILLYMGYALLPINDEVIIHYLHKYQYNILTDEIRILFAYLKRKELNHAYVLGVSSNILKWVWLESIPLLQRQMITDNICNVVTYQRNKQEVIELLLGITEPLFPIIVQHQYTKLRETVNTWLQGHII